MKKVLFICTHNSARSQMAEGLLRTMYGEEYEAMSAGTVPTELNPLAIKVMQEIGIDISDQTSTSVDEFFGMQIDYVATVCDQAKEACPLFPAKIANLHKSFPDPSRAEGTEEEKLRVFRRVRDEIKNWIEESFKKSKGDI